MDRLILNCDLGENEPMEQTVALLDLVDAANICCGTHAGNLDKTRETLARAQARGRLLGAHPGLHSHGGRGQDRPDAHEFADLLDAQVSQFLEIAADLGARVDYIKLHGTLYHAVEVDPKLAEVYLQFHTRYVDRLAVFALSGGRLARMAEAAGIRVYHEAFADRGYQRDGSLLPRSQAGAVLDAKAALERFNQWIEEGSMPTVCGQSIHLKADTLCVHGDSPAAIQLIQDLRTWIPQE